MIRLIYSLAFSLGFTEWKLKKRQWKNSKL